MRLTQPLPVLPAPEKLLRFRYCLAVTRAQSLFQFVRDDVVNHRGRCHPVLLLAHDAQGVCTKEDKTLTVPLAAVDAGFFVHARAYKMRLRCAWVLTMVFSTNCLIASICSRPGAVSKLAMMTMGFSGLLR